jgi:hypothetical protein
MRLDSVISKLTAAHTNVAIQDALASASRALGQANATGDIKNFARNSMKNQVLNEMVDDALAESDDEDEEELNDEMLSQILESYNISLPQPPTDDLNLAQTRVPTRPQQQASQTPPPPKPPGDAGGRGESTNTLEEQIEVDELMLRFQKLKDGTQTD